MPSRYMETTLTRISHDFFDADDANKTTIPVAFDFSAAFDTIDLSILISGLKHVLGLDGLALELVRTYLSGRTSFVKIGGERNQTSDAETGVLRGSALGPLLSYTLPFVVQQRHLQIRHPVPSIYI